MDFDEEYSQIIDEIRGGIYFFDTKEIHMLTRTSFKDMVKQLVNIDYNDVNMMYLFRGQNSLRLFNMAKLFKPVPAKQDPCQDDSKKRDIGDLLHDCIETDYDEFIVFLIERYRDDFDKLPDDSLIALCTGLDDDKSLDRAECNIIRHLKLFKICISKNNNVCNEVMAFMAKMGNLDLFKECIKNGGNNWNGSMSECSLLYSDDEEGAALFQICTDNGGNNWNDSMINAVKSNNMLIYDICVKNGGNKFTEVMATFAKLDDIDRYIHCTDNGGTDWTGSMKYLTITERFDLFKECVDNGGNNWNESIANASNNRDRGSFDICLMHVSDIDIFHLNRAMVNACGNEDIYMFKKCIKFGAEALAKSTKVAVMNKNKKLISICTKLIIDGIPDEIKPNQTLNVESDKKVLSTDGVSGGDRV